MKTRLLVAALALGATACTKSEPPAPPPPKPAVFSDPVPQMPDGHPALPGLAIASRGPRRMSVTQLERSLDAIGGFPKGTVKLPDNLALTLGRPDYKQVSQESLEPSPLFMKFMLDLASIYCANLAEYEPLRPANDKFFTRFATTDENIGFLVSRFLSLEGEPAVEYVERLKVAYATAEAGGKPLAGAQAVCMSLFTAPEFLLY